MKRSLFLIFVVLFFSKGILAQQPDFSNPQAYSFTKYVDNPVNKYYGRPDISIPIYTIKLKDFEFPITASYHPGGILVTEEASEIGLGWTLNAYGVITQVTRDLNDLYNPIGDVPINELSDNIGIQTKEYFARGYGDLLEWEGLSGEENYEKRGEFVDGYYNSEIDLFKYNLPNLSGTFFIYNDKFIDKKDPSLKIEEGCNHGFKTTARTFCRC